MQYTVDCDAINRTRMNVLRFFIFLTIHEPLIWLFPACNKIAYALPWRNVKALTRVSFMLFILLKYQSRERINGSPFQSTPYSRYNVTVSFCLIFQSNAASGYAELTFDPQQKKKAVQGNPLLRNAVHNEARQRPNSGYGQVHGQGHGPGRDGSLKVNGNKDARYGGFTNNPSLYR